MKKRSLYPKKKFSEKYEFEIKFYSCFVFVAVFITVLTIISNFGRL